MPQHCFVAKLKYNSVLSRNVKIRYFLSLNVKIRTMSRKNGINCAVSWLRILCCSAGCNGRTSFHREFTPCTGFFYWMCEHVPLEVTSCCARVFTLWTTERLFPWMGQHMPLEGTSSCAGVVALFANKKILSTVNQHVSFQMSSIDTWVAALVATVWVLCIMLKHMHF